MSTRAPVLQAVALRKAFGWGRRARHALAGITLEVHEGEILGVVGPNGAGKSTLLRMLAGEAIPDSGDVVVTGARARTREARGKLGYATDPPIIARDVSGLAWLRYHASHRACTKQERRRLLAWGVALTGLNGLLARPMRALSRGATQRVALATAAIAGSHALVLDELLSGVDPLAHRELRGQLVSIAQTGRAVVIASHDLGTLERVATRVILIDRGRVSADVAMADLLSQRVAELVVTPRAGRRVDRLVTRFPGAATTPEGIAVPLRRGTTLEEVLAACRAERLAVAASRVRHRALEDLFIASGKRGRDESR